MNELLKPTAEGSHVNVCCTACGRRTSFWVWTSSVKISHCCLVIDPAFKVES